MASTPLLGLSLPADGTTNWGTLVNTSITALLDSAVAGTTTLSSDADVILSATTEAANESRQAIILWKPLTGTVTRNITAPAQSKTYVVINATGGTQSIVFRGAGPTTGVTIPAGRAFMLAWNGTDFVTTGVTTVNLATDVTGTLGVGNGGTGQTTYTDGQLLIGNSTGNTLTKATLTAGTGISVTNGAGSISIANTAPDQTVTLTQGGATTITGTYPNFTISSVNTTYGTATSTVPGLIELGSDTVQTTAANAVTSDALRTYALQLNASGQAVVNVPWTSSSGTVTSVGATSPVASSGGTTPTISLSANYGDTLNPYASKTANNFLSAPNGIAGAPTFRAIVAADIPTLNQNTTGSAGSATNIAGGAANQIPRQSAAGTTTFIAAPTVATTFLSWNGSSFVWSTVTPATGTVFATDISVNSLTVGRGNSGDITSSTLGYQAAAAATSTAVQQTALGYRALASATTTAGVGFDYEGSTAIGYKALESSAPTLLSYNTAIGAGAMRALTTGGMNTAVGAGASRSMTGLSNASVAVGALAAGRSTVGGFTVVGYGALGESTTRSFDSVAVGVEALRYATTNSTNSALYNENNTAIGARALYFLDADTSGLGGSNNTALGWYAGWALESGNNNTILGHDAQASSVNVSNEITLGDSSVTTLRCQVTSITSLSDQRDKYDIEDLPVGLNLINALRPRRYKWDKRDWYVEVVETVSEDGIPRKQRVPTPKDGSRAQTDWNEGFVAQEAKAALQSLGADWLPLVYESNPEKLEMSSGKLIPVLVKAIQELSARIEALEAK